VFKRVLFTFLPPIQILCRCVKCLDATRDVRAGAVHGSLRAIEGGQPPPATRVVVREPRANEIRELENVSNSRKKSSREGKGTPGVTLELGGVRSYGHDSTDSNQNGRHSIRLRTHTRT